MEITKDIFFQFLKENNFYDEWLEGYQIDCDIYDEDIPLDNFFECCNELTWLYSGPGICAFVLNPEFPFKELVEKHTKWREKNQSRYMDLDEKWMNFVHNHKNN